MLHSLISLNKRFDQKIKINDTLIESNQNRIKAASEKIKVFMEKISSNEILIYTLLPSGEISKSKLSAIQRRQSILKRSIADIKLHIAKLSSDIKEYEILDMELKNKRACLIRKINKYEFFKCKLKREMYQRVVSREEAENEERISWL